MCIERGRSSIKGDETKRKKKRKRRKRFVFATWVMEVWQNMFSYDRICSLTTQYVLLRQDMFSCCRKKEGTTVFARICSLTTEYVLLRQNRFSWEHVLSLQKERRNGRLCNARSLKTEYVLLLQNMFSYYRICSLAIERKKETSLQRAQWR